MILEGILTTADSDGTLHAAAMGAVVSDGAIDPSSGRIAAFTLRPYSSSTTFGNLLARPEGVFHLTDDVLRLARILVGEAGTPETRPASTVDGRILADACFAHEFRGSFAHAGERPAGAGPPTRATFEATVTASHLLRPFIGFNRAQAAVLEAAILVSRIGILPRSEILSQVGPLAVIVEKTAGPRERQAFSILRDRLVGSSDSHGRTD
jgi:hypothetical protein